MPEFKDPVAKALQKIPAPSEVADAAEETVANIAESMGIEALIEI
ncbi:MAG: hypothetical protein ACE5OZ_07375 [Candidatus Heimdallarchaeota archaeon]